MCLGKMYMAWPHCKSNHQIILFIQTDNYIAFGLSGSDSGVQMFGSDVTWTWMNNEGVHAEELDINAYSQVLYYSFSSPNLITFII